MELTTEQKKLLVEQRLEQYRQQLFNLEIDVAALSANGDDKGVENTKQRIQAIEKAYQAVEGLV